MDVGADAQAGTAMVNFYCDMDVFGGDVVPWLGAGLGGAAVEYNVTDREVFKTDLSQHSVDLGVHGHL